MTEPTEPTEPEEPIEEEEEEDYPDNTTSRDDILNSEATSYDEWIDKINNLEFTAPDPSDYDTSSYEKIFQSLPVIIDSARYLYNTKTYRTQALLNESNVIFEDYKVKHKEILDKYPEETQHDQKVEELRALSNDYMNACLEITKRIDNINNEVNTETGFIGDVFIEGKLNNHDVSEYVLRSELEDYGKVDLTEYLKKNELKDEVYKQIPEIPFYINEMSCMITGMEEKIKNKLDKEALGYNDKETLVNGILFYNHQCCTLEEQSNKIAIKLFPLVEDNQMYYVDGWLYVKNYWNSEVVYRIRANALNTVVEVNTIDIIRSNGTNWTPAEGLHKISIGEEEQKKEYGAVIIDASDAYNWECYFTGYYHDIAVCEFVKGDIFTDIETFTVIDEHSLAKDINNKLALKADSEHTHTTEDITDLDISTFALKTELETKSDTNHKHTMADITDYEAPDIDTSNLATKDHTHNIYDLIKVGDVFDHYETAINSFYNIDNDIFSYDVDQKTLKFATVPSGEWLFWFNFDIFTNDLVNNKSTISVRLNNAQEYSYTNEAMNFSIIGGLGCAEGLKITLPQDDSFNAKISILRLEGFSKNITEVKQYSIIKAGNVLDERLVNGRGLITFIGMKVMPELSSTPNVFYKYYYKVDYMPEYGKGTFPLCKADSPCFQCKALLYGNGTGLMVFAFDIVYMNVHPEFGYICPYRMIGNSIQEPNASLVKATATDGQEIICLRLEWYGPSPGWFDYTIVSNQDIAGDDIEIESETALPNFEFYPILKDAKKDELSNEWGTDIATEGAVVKYVDAKIAELEARVAALEGK